MTPTRRDFLQACVRGRRNILISGGTGTGKTTTLNVLARFIPDDERIVTIEDAAELQLHQEHVVRLESRPANIEGSGARSRSATWCSNALRMRPDRIIVGEVRDGAALDMLQAMNTGHDGSITTVHANSPRDGLARLETMVLMAGVDLPVRAIREQVASALDLVVQQARLRDGTRRIVAITEVVGMEGDIITLQDLFTFDYSAGRDENGRYVGGLVADRAAAQVHPGPRRPRRRAAPRAVRQGRAVSRQSWRRACAVLACAAGLLAAHTDVAHAADQPTVTMSDVKADGSSVSGMLTVRSQSPAQVDPTTLKATHRRHGRAGPDHPVPARGSGAPCSSSTPAARWAHRGWPRSVPRPRSTCTTCPLTCSSASRPSPTRRAWT